MNKCNFINETNDLGEGGSNVVRNRIGRVPASHRRNCLCTVMAQAIHWAMTVPPGLGMSSFVFDLSKLSTFLEQYDQRLRLFGYTYRCSHCRYVDPDLRAVVSRLYSAKTLLCRLMDGLMTRVMMARIAKLKLVERAVRCSALLQSADGYRVDRRLECRNEYGVAEEVHYTCTDLSVGTALLYGELGRFPGVVIRLGAIEGDHFIGYTERTDASLCC